MPAIVSGGLGEGEKEEGRRVRVGGGKERRKGEERWKEGEEREEGKREERGREVEGRR